MRAAAPLCTLLLISGFRLAAQSDSAVVAGDRVRVRAPAVSENPFIGTVVSLGSDTLVLRVEDEPASTTIPVAAIERIEVSTGTRGHALTGFEVGFAVGAVAAGAAYAGCDGFLCPENKDVAEGAAAAALAGFFVGVPGALIGALVRSEEWEEVALGR